MRGVDSHDTAEVPLWFPVLLAMVGIGLILGNRMIARIYRSKRGPRPNWRGLVEHIKTFDELRVISYGAGALLLASLGFARSPDVPQRVQTWIIGVVVWLLTSLLFLIVVGSVFARLRPGELHPGPRWRRIYRLQVLFSAALGLIVVVVLLTT